MAAIELRGIRKSFGVVEVLRTIDLAIADGSFTVLVGPSGCGKSTLLRLVAGLEDITDGEVWIGGERVDHRMPASRGLAMVFQSYALYPHMSVEANLRFGLENQRLSRQEINARIARAADILQIGQLLARRPGQLSGGQSQRVAIGRAIVKEPGAFLFDEPLSNLDAELRVRMRGELISLHRRLGSTMVYVTHDQVEAMTMADRIVVLNKGRIEQAGPPVELYARPANLFVARFLGAPPMNLLAGHVVRQGNQCGVQLGGDAFLSLPEHRIPLDDGAAVTVGIRPEHIDAAGGLLPVTVNAAEVLGSETILHATTNAGHSFTLVRRGISRIGSGESLSVGLPDVFVHVFDEDGRAVGASPDWHDAYLQ